MFNSFTPSVADIAAVTRNDDSFGGNGAWWVIILLFALFGGFGRYGGYGGGENIVSGPLATQSDVQRGFDQQTLIGKIDGQTYGIADLGYAINTGLQNAELSRCNMTASLTNMIHSNEVADMQRDFAIQTALSDCCCQNREAISQVRFDNQTNTCAITTAIKDAVKDIIANDNANYRSLHDENVAAQIAAKDAKIAEQAAAINALNLAASQQAQNAYLIQHLGGNSCGGCSGYVA